MSYLGLVPTTISMPELVTSQVKRRHPAKKQQICSTTPALFVFNLGMSFEFDALVGDNAERAVDNMEESIKKVLR